MPRITLVHHVNVPFHWDAMLSHLDELGIKHVRELRRARVIPPVAPASRT
jgi:hypothetical protein